MTSLPIVPLMSSQTASMKTDRDLYLALMISIVHVLHPMPKKEK